MMKYIYSLLFLLVFVGSLHALRGKPILIPRSQSVNAARELVGWQETLNDVMSEHRSIAFSITPAYNQSFKSCDIARYLFGSPQLVVSGSRVANRGTCDILADYFGLPTDFQSTINFEPRIKTVTVDFNFYALLHLFDYCFDNNVHSGGNFFFRIHAPLVHTRWNLNACERTTEAGILNYPAGYMSRELIEREELPHTIQEALSGKVTFGDLQESLKFGKLACKELHKTKLSEIQCAAGYNIFVHDDYHAGVSLRVSVPTGNTPQMKCLFEPIVGNGGHWELGAGLTTHYIAWRSCDEVHSFGFYVDANVTHLFDKRQKRSFDFKNVGKGSKYMLLQEMSKPTIQGGDTDVQILVDGVQIELQYVGKLFPAINKTTLEADINIPFQADIVGKCSYTYCNWSFDIGYSFWIRAAERLVCREKFPNNCFALKGDVQLYGFSSPQIVALNATQQCATLRAGQGNGNTNDNFINSNADTPGLASLNFPGAIFPTVLFQTDILSDNTGITVLSQINGSRQPVLLNNTDIDSCSALVPRTHSHKLFMHSGYRWLDDDACLIPYLGIGTEVEWARECDNAPSAISQWGVWLKGGISY